MFASLLDNNLTQISTVNLCHVIFDNFDCKQKPDLRKQIQLTLQFAFQLCRLILSISCDSAELNNFQMTVTSFTISTIFLWKDMQRGNCASVTNCV